MSIEALETGAAAARKLALDVFNPSHTAFSIEERLNDLANALEDAARRLPPEGGANPTNRGGANTAARVRAEQVRALLTAYKAEEYYRDRKDILVDLDSAVDALLETIGGDRG